MCVCVCKITVLIMSLQKELCNMILDCCAQQRTYEKFFGLLAGVRLISSLTCLTVFVCLPTCHLTSILSNLATCLFLPDCSVYLPFFFFFFFPFFSFLVIFNGLPLKCVFKWLSLFTCLHVHFPVCFCLVIYVCLVGM